MIDFNNADRQGKPSSNVSEHPTARKQRVERQAKARIRELVRYLFPRAKMTARDARIGDISGDTGFSLSISIASDDSAGRFIDHANGNEKGDLFTLWGRLHGLDAHRDLPRIVEELDAWMGGAPPAAAQVRHVLEAAKPVEPEPEKTHEVTYTYKDKHGRKIAEVSRFKLSNGKKTFLPFTNGKAGMPAPRPLYGLELWHASEAVVIVEGEKCADALVSIGVDATSLMGGANTSIEKTDLTPLAGKTVVLWPDHDTPGSSLMDKLAEPLAALGCAVRRLTPPAMKPVGWDAADAVAEGFDVIGFLKAAPVAPERPRLPILDIPGLLSVPDPTWIIDGWVIDDGASVWYGPAKTFKTFNVLDMALSVACGVEWRGNAVVQQPVLYLLGEGMGTFKYRVHVWLAKRSEGRQARFWTIPVGVPLSTPEGLANALAAIDSLPVRPGLVVIDTLNRHFGPGDENSSQDMTRFVQSVDALRAHTRAHIAIVHHSGKDAEKGARGSSALLGAVDNEFRITRTEGTQICRIECTAARHSDEPKPMTVELVKVEVTHPESGLVMSSLLPVLRDEPQGGKDAKAAGKPLSKSARMVMTLLAEGPKFVKELVEETGLKRPTVQLILADLAVSKHVYAKEAEGAKLWYVLETEGNTHV
jgi:5S rRNA maturation endonuclease (ribonuclease M5)